MDWILFIAIAYSMVGVSLAERDWSVCLSDSVPFCLFRTCISTNFIVKHLLYCHFHAIYVTLLHINVHFKPYIFQGCIPLWDWKLKTCELVLEDPWWQRLSSRSTTLIRLLNVLTLSDTRAVFDLRPRCTADTCNLYHKQQKLFFLVEQF